MSSGEVVVRDATRSDMPAVCDLYNALIPTSTVAWTEVEQTLVEREAWFERQRRRGFPVLVAERADDAGCEVIGFTAYADFRGDGVWPGYRHTVEHTIHVHESAWGRGVGRALLTELERRAVAAGVHVMVAAIDGANVESIRFHERLGYSIVARMPEVGRKFDRWLELVLMQRILPTP
jgi:L-amino acid N-acyltransferase